MGYNHTKYLPLDEAFFKRIGWSMDDIQDHNITNIDDFKNKDNIKKEGLEQRFWDRLHSGESLAEIDDCEAAQDEVGRFKRLHLTGRVMYHRVDYLLKEIDHQ
jgi:hypothetical protein